MGGSFLATWAIFDFWVLERSLERKKKILHVLEILLDFAIFFILSYQYDIILQFLYNFFYNFSKFSL